MRWGILATGNIAHKFAATVAKMEPDEQVVAVASRSREKADLFAQEFAIPLAFDSLEALAACTEVEAIYIAAPNMMHAEMVRLCLQHGKPVLCEKPLTTSKKESQRLYELAREKKLFLMEAFWVRFLPLYQKLVQELNSGVIGEPKQIQCSYGFVSSGPRRLTKLKPELGGGALMDIGIYCLGFLQIVHPGPMRYCGGTVEFCEFGTDEACTMKFEWDGGTAQVELSVKAEMPRLAVIRGSRGRIELPDFQHAEQYTVYPDGAQSYEVKAPMELDGFAYQIREASKCVREGRWFSPRNTSEQSLELIERMDLVRATWNC